MSNIAEKIRKILAKAQSTTHEDEADALFAKAKSMMEEHQISAAELQDGSDPINSWKSKAYQRGTPASLRYWMEGEVAQFYGCRVIEISYKVALGTKPREALEFFGPESAMITSQLMFPFIWKQVLDKSKARSNNPSIQRKHLKEICHALALKLYRLRRASTPQGAAATEAGKNALVLVGNALDAFVSDRYPNLGEAKAWEPKFGAASAALADQISLTHQMGKQVDKAFRIGGPL